MRSCGVSLGRTWLVTKTAAVCDGTGRGAAGPLGVRYRLVDLERVERLDHGRVTAVARVREIESRVVYTLRYRLRLKRTDRWLALGVEG